MKRTDWMSVNKFNAIQDEGRVVRIIEIDTVDCAVYPLKVEYDDGQPEPSESRPYLPDQIERLEARIAALEKPPAVTSDHSALVDVQRRVVEMEKQVAGLKKVFDALDHALPVHVECSIDRDKALEKRLESLEAVQSLCCNAQAKPQPAQSDEVVVVLWRGMRLTPMYPETTISSEKRSTERSFILSYFNNFIRLKELEATE